MGLAIRRAAISVHSMGLLYWWRRRRAKAGSRENETAARAAAVSGVADAQFGLGLFLSTDVEGRRDLNEAAQWYEKAARQGHALAQFNLAVMFARGQGVVRDEAMSLTWTRRAAEGGDAGAQHLLGRRYHRSSIDRLAAGCAESRIEAYKWFRLSANQGYTGSREACDEMTLHMSRENVTAGNLRVASFVAHPQVN